ncbi:MAG: response regulator transcription factor [Bacteroidales bacterium]|nr:response regulator transcription factor [Bacteroidales bacterium]
MLRILIIDDEPDCIVFLAEIIKSYCPFIEIAGTATTVPDGINEILKTNPDLVLLDVEMSPGTGFDILNRIPQRNFKIIFITAHNDYAIQAFRYSAVDYILKPIDIADLISAINKVNQSVSHNHLLDFNVLLDNIKTDIPHKLAIPTSSGYEYILVNEIIHIEADRSYCIFHLTNKRKIMVSKCLNDYQQILDTRIFFRIHHSFLINLQHVKSFSRKDGGFVETIDGSQIPIARRKKDYFYEAMKRYAI